MNRNRKKCRQRYYHSKVSHLKSSKPKQGWSEVKRICGHTPLSEIDSSSLLNTVVGMNHLSPNEMAKLINDALWEPQLSYDPLSTSNKIDIDHQESPIHKHLRPISLTSVISKVAEDFVLERELKDLAILKILDPNQLGVVPKSSTTLNLMSLLHEWLSATDIYLELLFAQYCLTLEKRLTLLTIIL